MAISISCHCGNTISAPERLAGRTLRCPKCLGEFTVPQAAAAPPPPPFMPEPAPLAAMSAPAPAFSPEATIPEAPDQAFAPGPDLSPEPAFEATEEQPFMEPAAAAAEPEQDFEVVEEVGDDLANLETQPGTYVPPQEDGMTFGEAGTQEGQVMGEEELGLFLMEDEPAAPSPPAKKKKKKSSEEDNVFG